MTARPPDVKLPEVPLSDLAVPIDLCYTVPEGCVDPRSIADLRTLDFTQAVVCGCEVSRPLYGIVTVEQLEHLSREGIPLRIDDPSTDRFVLESYGAGLAGYEIAMLGPLEPMDWLRHMRPTAPLDRLLEVLSTRPAVLIEWHETTELLDGTRLPGADPESDPEIVGLVTRADLNKHPIRVIIYEVLAKLEMALADLVREHLTNHLGWIRRLSEESQARILGYWELSKLQGVDLGPVVGATLADLLNVLARNESLRGRLGYGSRNTFDDAVGGIPGVRNQVMHCVRPLITDAESCLHLRAVLGEAIRLTQHINSALQEEKL